MRKTAPFIAGALLAVVAVLGASAYAGPLYVLKEAWKASSLSATAIDSTAYTGWMQTEQYRSMALEINFTRSAATNVTMSCETSDDATTTNGAGFDLHILSDTATVGTSESDPHVWRFTTSASAKWTWTVANLPHNYLNCWFDGASADGSDKVTVRYRRITP